MKLLTLSKIGYNHPSQANWSYGIWKIDFIDTKQGYCASEIVKETFGGDERFKQAVKKLKPSLKVIETKSVYTRTGTQKITGISSLLDIESKELLAEVKEWLDRK